MATFRPDQRRLTVGDRTFHFVSYEAQEAIPRKDQEAQPAMWYLMVEGRRCPVFPYDPALDDAEVDAALLAWVSENDLDQVPTPEPAADDSHEAAHSSRNENWWGPQ